MRTSAFLGSLLTGGTLFLFLDGISRAEATQCDPINPLHVCCGYQAGQNGTKSFSPLPATTMCRPASDICDREEYCDGVGPTCPSDVFQPDTLICRKAPQGPTCQKPVTCTGTGPKCPALTSAHMMSAGTICRAATGVCDSPEVCQGNSTVCPLNAMTSRGTVCRPSVGPCDVAETCSGTSPTCPEDLYAPATTVCRYPAGPCDVAETCTGSATNCPVDSVAPPTTVCSAKTSNCDVESLCSGSGVACPAKDFTKTDGQYCAPAFRLCDAPDQCSNGICVDRVAPSTTVCRPKYGLCDVEEKCTGTSTSCPLDAKLPANSTCLSKSEISAVTGSAEDCLNDATCDGRSPLCIIDNSCTSTTTFIRRSDWAVLAGEHDGHHFIEEFLPKQSASASRAMRSKSVRRGRP